MRVPTLALLILATPTLAAAQLTPTWRIIPLTPDTYGLGALQFSTMQGAYEAIKANLGSSLFYRPPYWNYPAPTSSQESAALATITAERPSGNTAPVYGIKFANAGTQGYCLDVTAVLQWDVQACTITKTQAYSLGSVADGPSPPTFSDLASCQSAGAALKAVNTGVVNYSCSKSQANGTCTYSMPPWGGLGVKDPCAPETTAGWMLEFPACEHWSGTGSACSCDTWTNYDYGNGYGPTPPPYPDGTSCYSAGVDMQVFDDNLGQYRAQYGSPSCQKTNSSGHGSYGYSPYPPANAVSMRQGCH